MNRLISIIISLFLALQLFSQSTIAEEYVTAKASTQYANPSFFHRILIGTNYRKEWETPVRVPVFHLKKMGFKILELGGGMQTKSLKLQGKNGREWSLRSVEKNVEPNLPKWLQNTFAERTVQDMISAAHPYAPLTIPTLAKAMSIVVPVPTLYFVPDDPDLGEHRSLFANTLCMLEEREPTPNKEDTKSTENMLEDLVDENDHLVIQQAVLKARLLDMLVGDWDRHADQWRWGVRDSADVKYYYAIPRDRDQAYFYYNGLLPKLARIITLKHLISYHDNLNSLKNLNYKAWDFDGVFLNELDRTEWEAAIKRTQKGLTDDLIHEAIKKLPPEVYPISGPLLEKKLKGRRDDLYEEGMKYYEFLSGSVIVNGTDDAEVFEISGNSEKLLVTVYDQRDGKRGRKIYERNFDPNDTHEITIYALDGDDQVISKHETKSHIRLNIWGGKGADIYSMQGDIRNTIYDAESDGNKLENTSGSRIKKITH